VIRLTVVLPCYNARATLERALQTLEAQDVPEDVFEIIVVDDGSTDGTGEMIRDWSSPVTLRLVQQPNRGAAAARNLGAMRAQGEVLLFLDPDVFADPGLVRAHLRHYTAGTRPLAVQGRTSPDPATLVTPFMHTSHLMPIPDLTIRREDNLSPFHVFGRNFSVSRTAYQTIGGFDEGFRGYGWEDVEFAFRFCRAGGRIKYEPDACGTHHHVLSMEDAARRQVDNGRAAVYFWRKHDRSLEIGLRLEIYPLLLPLKWLVFQTGCVTRLVRTVQPWAERNHRLLVLNECHNHLLWQGYYTGVFAALRERPLPACSTSGAPS
jgi:GT2 family glycosyltransferase